MIKLQIQALVDFFGYLEALTCYRLVTQLVEQSSIPSVSVSIPGPGGFQNTETL